MKSRSGLALTIGFAAESVRETGPLVHCIAPAGATPFVADVLFGVGARSVITGTSDDALAASLSADAIALDLATMSAEWSENIVPTASRAHTNGTPWVLDVSSLGRAAVRLDRVRALLANAPTVIRSTSGRLDDHSIDPGKGVVVTGVVPEKVRSVDETISVPPGAALLAQVPGVRTAVCALIAACATVTQPTQAALTGTAWAALASERAAQKSRGPASFRIALVDALSAVRGDEIATYLNLT